MDSMKRFLLLWSVMLAGYAAGAQAPLTLAIPPDARAGGMGNVGVATSPDAAAQYWNVAKYAFAGETAGGVQLSYTPWLRNVTGGMNLLYASGYGMWGEQAVSASFRYFSVGDIEVANSDGSYANASPRDLAFDLGYSRRFGNLFSVGVAFRYVSTSYQEHVESFVTNTAGAFAADIGAYMRLPVSRNEWTVGLAFTNIGTKLDMGNGNKVSLPMNVGIGTQYAWQVQKEHLLRVALDINQPLVNPSEEESIFKQLTLSGGAEYGFRKTLFARAGYYYSSPDAGDRSHVTVGVGLCFYNINLDGSYLIAVGGNNNAMKDTWRITLGYTFGTNGKLNAEN